jgi:hypothetical protein
MKVHDFANYVWSVFTELSLNGNRSSLQMEIQKFITNSYYFKNYFKKKKGNRSSLQMEIQKFITNSYYFKIYFKKN